MLSYLALECTRLFGKQAFLSRVISISSVDYFLLPEAAISLIYKNRKLKDRKVLALLEESSGHLLWSGEMTNLKIHMVG